MNRLFRLISLATLLLLTVQCHNPKTQKSGGEAANDTLVHYADLLSITRHDGFTDVAVTNPWDTTRLLHRYLLGPRDEELPANLPQGTVVRTPLEKTLVYSSVHASALELLGARAQPLKIANMLPGVFLPVAYLPLSEWLSGLL